MFKKLLICVDFDGCIVPDTFPTYPKEFIPDAKESLILINQMGHELILWTLRDRISGYSSVLQDALQFLNENDLGFIRLPRHYQITTPKFPADLYIDDKNIGGLMPWKQIIEEIKKISNIFKGEINNGN